jgi:hypothetical protein
MFLRALRFLFAGFAVLCGLCAMNSEQRILNAKTQRTAKYAENSKVQLGEAVQL